MVKRMVKRMVTRKSLPAKGIECKESGSGIKAIYQFLILAPKNREKNKNKKVIC